MIVLARDWPLTSRRNLLVHAVLDLGKRAVAWFLPPQLHAVFQAWLGLSGNPM